MTTNNTLDLDLAVARLEGLPVRLNPMGFSGCIQSGWWVWDERRGFSNAVYKLIGHEYSPSTNWRQGGPIIEREKINLRHESDGWYATIGGTPFTCSAVADGTGDTALIAAMRCYIASKEG